VFSEIMQLPLAMTPPVIVFFETTLPDTLPVMMLLETVTPLT
jgi:hypothetical protein